jgi:hypothetical protein
MASMPQRKRIVTLGVASVDAAAEKARPKLLEGRAASVTPPVPTPSSPSINRAI